MSWAKTSQGKVAGLGSQNQYDVLTETVTLGAAKANRYSSAFSVPPGVGFTVMSNTSATNLSGSASDQLYAAYTVNGTYRQVKDTLRDCNYANDAQQGTSFRDLDAATRVRYVDTAYIGQFPYYKIRILQAAVESSSMTVGLAVMIGSNPRDPFK